MLLYRLDDYFAYMVLLGIAIGSEIIKKIRNCVGQKAQRVQLFGLFFVVKSTVLRLPWATVRKEGIRKRKERLRSLVAGERGARSYKVNMDYEAIPLPLSR
jgi:hypothetical protein